MSDLDKVLAHIDADFDNAIARLFETLRIRSISTDPLVRNAAHQVDLDRSRLCRRLPGLRRVARQGSGFDRF